MRPVIFNIVATHDDEARVWIGHCDEIPAAASAESLDDLFDQIRVMAMDLLPDNHAGLYPAQVHLQLSALRSAVPKAA